MFDNSKIKEEYSIFKNYLSVIYYYGSIYETEEYPLKINIHEFNRLLPIDYNITKLYNTLSHEKVVNLSNNQKILFLLDNIKMLNYLASKGYIHCDYKIDNVAYDSPEKMNVILIDYDITTLQKLTPTNKYFAYNSDNTVSYLMASTTYKPNYLTKSLPLSKWDKYSIGGLAQIIRSLNIRYNFNTLRIDSNLSNNKITIISSLDMVRSLNLLSKDYNNIPTYTELHTIFSYLHNNRYIM
jgi:serine/threonine protein kinase